MLSFVAKAEAEAKAEAKTVMDSTGERGSIFFYEH